MSNKKVDNKSSLQKQLSISKFFSLKSNSNSRRRRIDEVSNITSNEPSKKTARLNSRTSDSNSSSKYELSEDTIARIQSHSIVHNDGTAKRTDHSHIVKHLSKNTTPLDNDKSQNEASSSKSSLFSDKVTHQGPSKDVKYTPLEKQYLEFKHKCPDAILLVECGYKYKFFGADAEIASKILNIACFLSHNFMTAIIPVQRMHYHVRKLVLKGYKVGVIKQTETAALKAAGDKKNELFTRELHALYTKSTLIGEEFQAVEEENNNLDGKEICDTDTSSSYLVCIFETLLSNKRGCNITIVGVNFSSGDLVQSSFYDELALRNKLESSLYQLNPSEILLPSTLSKETESLINGFSYERSARIEKIEDKYFDSTSALEKVSKFFSQANNLNESSYSESMMQKILTFPSGVISCLSALIEYLSSFKLENILHNVMSMNQLSSDGCMVLTAATLKGLEITRNNSTHSEYGSLFWVLNRTHTKFGERLLKSWISKPLKDYAKIEERLDILSGILYSESIIYKVVEKVLNKLPDLERVLCSVFYQKCSCFDFVKLTEAFTKIHMEFNAISDQIKTEDQVSRMKRIICDIPVLLGDVEKYLSNIDPEAAKIGDKTKIFRDLTLFPELKKCKEAISNFEQHLDDLRPDICKTLRLFSMKFATVSGQKFLIEVPNSNLGRVPKDWLKVSATKQVSRYRSPEVIKYSKEIDKQNELLVIYANDAWCNYLSDFGKNFYKYKRAISYLAELDCYLSFAKVSKEEGFCRPHILNNEDRVFNIVQGRHPVITKLMDGKQFVANDISLSGSNNCVIVTGPNMGGKSTYVRQTALIALTAHIGCYVPAESATIPLFDNIYVRMGADDDLINRKSTFMVEMCEASEILHSATSKSFAVLDELGRGTSTNDGTAVAYAALEHLIADIKCLTVFVTHYPEILELKQCYPDKVATMTMAYILKDNDDDSDVENVTFLYNAISGISEKSYGINVAALAGIPKTILKEAHEISLSRSLRTEIMRKLKQLSMKIKLSKSLSS